jgi:hypothetical protein
MIFDIIFPIIDDVPDDMVLEYSANPKAVCAQTFKSPSMSAPFIKSGAYAILNELFNVQYRLYDRRSLGLSIEPPNLTCLHWIAFPFAIKNGEKRACLVWRENNGQRWHRHIRLYQTLQDAQIDNDHISNTVTKLISEKY